MYIFIKPEKVDEVKQHLEELKKNSNENQIIITSYNQESGRTLIQTHQNPFDITYDMEEIPQEFIDEITIYGYHIDNALCFRTEGIYKLGNAKLQCYIKTYNHDGGVSVSMIINISAQSLKSLQKIYTQFRLGKITPAENWETPQIPKDEKSTDPDQSTD